MRICDIKTSSGDISTYCLGSMTFVYEVWSSANVLNTLSVVAPTLWWQRRCYLRNQSFHIETPSTSSLLNVSIERAKKEHASESSFEALIERQLNKIADRRNTLELELRALVGFTGPVTWLCLLPSPWYIDLECKRLGPSYCCVISRVQFLRKAEVWKQVIAVLCPL